MKKKKDLKNIEDERMGLFMNHNSFNLDVMYGRNYLQTDNTQRVRLFRMDLIGSKSHSLYGQTKSKDKKFMSPVTLSVMLTISDGQQEYYGNSQNGITRDDTGKLSFGIYLDELKEKNTEVNRGDIIEYNLSGEKNRFYEIENVNSVSEETSKSIGGFKNYWKRIVAVPVKEDVVPFLSETKGF